MQGKNKNLKIWEVFLTPTVDNTPERIHVVAVDFEKATERIRLDYPQCFKKVTKVNELFTKEVLVDGI